MLSLLDPGIPTGFKYRLGPFVSEEKKGKYGYLCSSRSMSSLSSLCLSSSFTRPSPHPPLMAPSLSSLCINCPSLSLLSIYPFTPFPLSFSPPLVAAWRCCVFVWEGEAETGRDGMKDGRARPLWRRRGMEVSRPLQTGAKWCHAVPLSDHLSAWLASTQVIKVPCPSCEIKGHITKGQFGSVLNHIYCSSITGSLFSPRLAAETIMRMPAVEKTTKTSTFFEQSDASTCRSPPSSIYRVNLDLWLQSLPCVSFSLISCVALEAAVKEKENKKELWHISVNLEE